MGSRRVEDATAFHLFLTGLKPAVRDRVMMETSPTTIEDLILLAERVDQSQWWRSREFSGRRGVYGGGRAAAPREHVRNVS